jgi:hypothetical protein
MGHEPGHGNDRLDGQAQVVNGPDRPATADPEVPDQVPDLDWGTGQPTSTASASASRP